MNERYDTIGTSYARRRQPDPRIAAALHEALGNAATILNVGAGAGSYEPADSRSMTALEPSWVMIRQRPRSAAPVVQGRVESLPFRSDTFEAVMGVLTVHHWQDRARGFAECNRVCTSGGRLVFLTIDSTVQESFWLFRYWPEILELDRRIFPTLSEFRTTFAAVENRAVPIPYDCSDGFLGAYWRRPEAYLDPTVRASMSGFARIEPRAVDRGVAELHADLESGHWHSRYAPLLRAAALDIGYRIVVASKS